MKAPWEYFDDLDEIIYVIDYRTYDLIYMNRYTRKQFSIASEKAYRGKKCYAILQGLPGPCPFCTNAKLREGKFYEWKYRNPILQQTFLLKDTLISWEGNPYRVEIAISAGEEGGTAQDHLYYESFVNDCLTQTHSAVEPEESLNILMRFLGEHMHCSRVDLYEASKEDWLHHTYHWGKGEKQDAPLKMKFVADLCQWYVSFRHNSPIFLSDMEHFSKVMPELYNYFGSPGRRQSILLTPLLSSCKVIGFLRVDNPSEPQGRVSDICRILCHFILTMLERRDLMVHLKRLSYHDQLTGALNRHAMGEYVAGPEFEKAVGMLYCDINGLKNTNDLLGHEDGNRLIRQTYGALTAIFRKDQVYRIGGDEFLVLFPCQDEAQFHMRLELLHRELVAQNCDLSVGGVWAPAGKKNFDSLLKTADERMYQSKRAFYSQKDPATGVVRQEQRQYWRNTEIRVNEKNPFQIFAKNYYFDSEAFFKSIAMDDTSLYLYCGDMQKNVFYISDNLRRDFNFSSNLIYDFITLLEQRIYEGDRQMHMEDTREMLEKKRTVHSIRYRIYNKQGEPVWMHCRGILKWNEEKTKPLFFSGSMVTLSNESELDQATGMMSLSYALDRLRKLCEQKQELLLLCFSLNSFADINRMLGRGTGDQILWEIGSTLRKEMGNDFRFARVDGLRFFAFSRTVLEPRDPVWNIQRIVRSIYRMHGANIMYPCAVGGLRSPRDGRTAGDLVENAMVVLKEAKSAPEKGYVEFSADLRRDYKDKTDLSMALNACVNRMFEGFRIVIQPQVLASTGRIYGGEVLLRWEHQGCNVSPGKFIPMLEQTGLIIPVGKWVVYQAALACQQILRICPDFKISFNVSYLQILDKTLLPFLKSTLQNYKLPGENLIIELTETHFDTMPEHLQDFVHQCKSLGITFALDDFGNAYSSLQLLLQYPADLIKLDRTLMQEITSSKEKMDFIMSIIYACHRFGKKVCVEGVEKKEELDIVRQTECDYIQGFYFYKPMELKRIYQVLEKDMSREGS